jgi:hypothetical protein
MMSISEIIRLLRKGRAMTLEDCIGAEDMPQTETDRHLQAVGKELLRQGRACDYCGGDKATNLTDMGDTVCTPCLIGRPVAPLSHDVQAAELWLTHKGNEFVLRAVIANLLRQNEEMRAAIAALPEDVIYMTVTD